MKKLLYVGALSTLLLAACGDTEDKESTVVTATEQNEVGQNEEPKKEIKKEESVGSNEVKNGPLIEAGQWTMDGDNKVTLVKIKNVNQSYEIGPLVLNIESVKLLQHSKPEQLTVDLIQNIHNKDVSAGLNTIQVIYTIENTSDKNIMFTTINKVTTDTKAQIEGMYNFASSADLGSYAGQVILEGLAIYPYFTGSLEEINTVNIITGDVFDSDSYEKQADSQKIEITLWNQKSPPLLRLTVMTVFFYFFAAARWAMINFRPA